MGADLVIAAENLKSKTNEWQHSDGPPPTAELIDAGVASLIRFVRVGFCGILLALLPTLFLIVQIYLLNAQNGLIGTQNDRIETQNILSESHRRSGLIIELSSILDQLATEHRTWFETHDNDTKIQIEKDLFQKPQPSIPVETSGFRFIAGGVQHLDVNGNVIHDWQPPAKPLYKKFTPSKLTVGRITALSLSLKPYKFIDYTPGGASLDLKGNDTNILPAPLSPERAQILISLLSSGIELESFLDSGITFAQADLRNAVLTGFDLRNLSLAGADMSNSNCRGAHIAGTSFAGTNLRNADLSYTANWTKTVCPEARLLAKATLKGANLNNALAPNPNWLDELEKFEIDGFVRNEWEIRNRRDHHRRSTPIQIGSEEFDSSSLFSPINRYTVISTNEATPKSQLIETQPTNVIK